MNPIWIFYITLATLTEKMVEKMRKGQRRWGDSWLDRDPEYMLDRVEEEYYEFRQALLHKRDIPEAMVELADMSNYAIMAVVLAKRESEDE